MACTRFASRTRDAARPLGVDHIALRPAVFVDRDGVLNQLVVDGSGRPESPLDPRQVELLPGITDAFARLRQAGYSLVGISNQPAAAKGTVTLKQLGLVQRRLLDLLECAGARLDGFQICYHHPHGVVTKLTRSCDCRKPAPGMLIAAAKELGLDLSASWVVGDTDTDVAAGLAAGCRTVLVETPGSAHKRATGLETHARVPDLRRAADYIIAAQTR